MSSAHQSWPPTTYLSTQAREDRAGRKDFEAAHYDAIEMVVARNQGVGATLLGELDEIVVAGICRHHPRRINWIGKPDRFLLNAPAEFIDLIRCDAVPTRDPGVEESLANFAHKLRAGDQLEHTITPEVQES